MTPPLTEEQRTDCHEFVTGSRMLHEIQRPFTEPQREFIETLRRYCAEVLAERDEARTAMETP